MMSELQLTPSQKQIVDTPENWDAASEGYAQKVAPYLMESFAQDHMDRLDVNRKSETLDVVAGSGALTELLAQNVRCLLATYFSPKMIEQVKKKISEAGFKDVEVEFVQKDLVLGDFKSMWDMLTAGAPSIQMIFDQVGAEGKDRIHDALANIIDSRFGNGPISILNTATFGRGLAA